MFVKEYKIPAKAMLFGEYGVLQYLPAVAVTFYDYYFTIRIQIKPKSQSENGVINIKSSYFKNGEISFSFSCHPVPASAGINCSRDPVIDPFFYQLLLPWKNYLADFNVFIEILESFESSLGFGSSSAIIAGVSLALYEYFSLSNEQLWEFVRKSILNIQGRGSGYDVGVQLAAVLSGEKKLSCWSFQNQISTCVPIIPKLNISENLLRQYGCFLKTHIYSDTKKILARPMEKEVPKLHGELALNFLQDFSLENLKDLIIQAHNLFVCSEELENVVAKLQGLHFKSMGAGHGDCLWVLCSKDKLMERGFLEEDIAFSFEQAICL